MGHLGQGVEITTIQDNEIVLTASNGQHFRMKIADFVKSAKAYASTVSVPYDANDIIENGSVTVVIGNIAGHETLYKNYPNPYGVLFNINGGEYFSAQMFFDPIGFVRVRIKNNETWGAWNLISFT